MRHIRPNIHQMRNALPALALSVTLEEFTHLEEEHHEDGLGKLGLGTGEETDQEGTDGGHRHEEMLVEGITVGDTLPRLVKRLVTD